MRWKENVLCCVTELRTTLSLFQWMETSARGPLGQCALLHVAEVP